MRYTAIMLNFWFFVVHLAYDICNALHYAFYVYVCVRRLLNTYDYCSDIEMAFYDFMVIGQLFDQTRIALIIDFERRTTYNYVDAKLVPILFRNTRYLFIEFCL